MLDTEQPAGFAPGDSCPPSYSVRMLQLAYETLWDTRQFYDKFLWPANGSQPFFWSTGDGEAYSTHVDYISGRKESSLQNAMDSSCMFNACGNGKPFKYKLLLR
jgi:hypothetical protein